MNIDLVRKIDRIHPYPAKFTVDLAMQYISKYTSEGETVYDPFAGSGTTMLAASVLNRRGIGTDINHIAVLISQFKLLHLSDEEISDLTRYIAGFEKNYKSECGTVCRTSYPSIEHWFCEDAILCLSYIKESFKRLMSDREVLFAKLVMSAIINTVSNQESDTRYAAIEKKDITLDRVAQVYINKFKTALDVFSEFNGMDRDALSEVRLMDSKLCTSLLGENTVDMILTSPPYINTYDYYLYHKHRMNWLGYDVDFSMKNEIGSRREFSSLKHSEDKFDDDLRAIFEACDVVLKPGGVAVIVIGDGKVAGKMYDAKENLEKICRSLGWILEDYSFSFLDNTSRSFQKSYRTKGKKEHVITVRKGKKHED